GGIRRRPGRRNPETAGDDRLEITSARRERQQPLKKKNRNPKSENRNKTKNQEKKSEKSTRCCFGFSFLVIRVFFGFRFSIFGFGFSSGRSRSRLARHGILVLELRRVLFAEFGDLGPDHRLAVALSRVLAEIALVIIFGPVKLFERCHLGHNGSVP